MATIEHGTPLGWILLHPALGWVGPGGMQRCHGLAIRPDRPEIWSACGASVTLHDMTEPLHAELARIPLDARAYWLTFSPDGRFALVTNSLSDTVSKINTDTFLVVASIPVPQVPQGIDVRGQGDFAYVAGSRLARVAKIDLARNLVVANVAVPAAPVGLRMPAALRAFYDVFGSIEFEGAAPVDWVAAPV